MMWDIADGLEVAEIVGTDRTLMVAVAERPASTAVGRSGVTEQRVELLLPEAERIVPPARLLVRDLELRVLGTQMPPWQDAPALITCQLVNPDLPDDVTFYRVVSEFDPEANRHVDEESAVWSGACHVASGDPRLIDTAGELAPLERVTITCITPVVGVDLTGLWARVTHAVNPAVAGDYKLVGEALDSTSRLRRFVAERKGAL